MTDVVKKGFRSRALGAGLKALGASGLPRLAQPFTQGRGAILMFHHIRPWAGGVFTPNRGLEITPEFLDETIAALHGRGFDIVPLGEIPARLRQPNEKPFAALTFDDGYRDNLVHAIPVLEKYGAPFTIYIATGFADGTARLWWVELENAIRALDSVPFAGQTLPASAADEKMAAFLAIYWNLRAGSEARLLDEIARIAALARIDGAALTRGLCMNWEEIAKLATHPLCTIGAHTVTHPRLAKLGDAPARQEMAASRDAIEARLGQPVRHFAFPVGDPTSASPREFAVAAELGFDTAVTTRKGMIFDAHAGRLTALPRLSVNGDYQERAYLELLLTGAPFWLWNRGRRIAA